MISYLRGEVLSAAETDDKQEEIMTIYEMTERKRELGYSNEVIAELSGVPLGTVQKIFGGITKSPRKETIAALEKVLKRKTTDYYSGAVLNEPIAAYIKEKVQGEYTVEDYFEIPDDIRTELIDGSLYYMSAPTLRHQDLALEMAFQIKLFIKEKGGPCEVFIAPVDVQLDCDNRTMVQPDVMILCDKSKSEGGKRILGAPDFVCEILSDSTAKRDQEIKLKKYRDAGVREYWIIGAESGVVQTYDFNNSKFGIYSIRDEIPMSIYNGELKITLE